MSSVTLYFNRVPIQRLQMKKTAPALIVFAAVLILFATALIVFSTALIVFATALILFSTVLIAFATALVVYSTFSATGVGWAQTNTGLRMTIITNWSKADGQRELYHSSLAESKSYSQPKASLN